MASVAFQMSSLSLSAPKATLGRSSFGGKQVRLATIRPVQKIETSIEAKQGHNRAGKLKTNKAAAKRFKVTGTGKVMRRQAGKQHLLAKKSPSRKHSLEGECALVPGDYNNAIGQLPHSGIKKPGNQKKCTKP
uniref:50S ribosomal protein L35 n=1 Tax=Pyramimonas obovata TaxID=1411642 RepID=A0A7S0QUA2_9CHLO|eukprot:CAMPEP_0118921570 /NCGR_PEP_ID=MMETSP1169-20130426/801_1 /TAXON_ID=36882 /ORGANISM="Pyramimonas obovata, Strain CCMP722" /LENGTH=132 /DNA_ID=CAMNT_0006862315 /DNA_START=65 /DNA_END=463 /DNA_ORIENTATION=-